MKKNRYRLPRFLCVLFLVAGILAAEESRSILFADKFTKKLQQGWSWVRETTKAWKIDKKGLHLVTSPGGLWGKTNDNRNILLRSLPEGKQDTDVVVEVCMENDPKAPYEHGGLIWYYDDDNWVYLVKEHFEGKPHILVLGEKQGNPKLAGRYYKKTYGSKMVWLRLELKGKELVSKYRASPKKSWETLGTYQLPGTGKVQVGVTTGYGDAKSQRISTFKDFRIAIATSEDKK